MIQLFRSNQPLVYLLLLLYAIVLRGSLLFFIPALSVDIPVSYSFVGQGLLGWLMQKQPIWLLQLFDILLVYANALFLNFILTSNGLFTRRTQVPALIFITLSSLFGEWIEFGVETLTAPFILLSLYNLFALSRNELSRDNIFYTALYTSIACLFYFPAVVFLLVVLVGLFIRSYSIRDFILILIGFIFPFYFIGIYYYYTRHLADYLHHFREIFTPTGFVLDLGLAHLGFILLILILCIYGYLKLSGDEDFRVSKIRRLYRLLAFYITVIVIGVPFIFTDKLSYLQLLIMPASVFCARIFDREKLRFYHSLIFILLLGGILLFQLSYFKIIDLGDIKF